MVTRVVFSLLERDEIKYYELSLKSFRFYDSQRKSVNPLL